MTILIVALTPKRKNVDEGNIKRARNQKRRAKRRSPIVTIAMIVKMIVLVAVDVQRIGDLRKAADQEVSKEVLQNPLKEQCPVPATVYPGPRKGKEKLLLAAVRPDRPSDEIALVGLIVANVKMDREEGTNGTTRRNGRDVVILVTRTT